jgi:hypothetical protein
LITFGADLVGRESLSAIEAAFNLVAKIEAAFDLVANHGSQLRDALVLVVAAA